LPLRSWEEHQQLWACKNMELRSMPCPEARPFRPQTWCGECQEAAGLAPAGAVTPLGSADEAQALERRVSGATRLTEAEQCVISAAFDVIWHEGLHDHHDDEDYWRTKKSFWLADLRRAIDALAAERDLGAPA
jgi:hypothetical protein